MSKRYVRITDTTLRDGSHAVSHQFRVENIRNVVRRLDQAGVPVIEVSHGDGLGGNSVNYGFGLHSEEELLRAAVAEMKQAKLAVLILPGVGVREDLEMAHGAGAKIARVATHCTEADVSEQHIGFAKKIGMEVVTFLMMSHMVEPAKLMEQAKLMESYGADCIYVVDSAGALLPDQVRARVATLKEGLSCQVGFHAHNNLGLAIGNTLAALEEGADQIDGSTCGLGAGAGNAQTEILAAVLDKAGYETGIDLYGAMDAAEEAVRPIMHRPIIVDKNSLTIGYAGVYSSFLLHARRAGERFGVDARDILMEMGRRKAVGGQEDLILIVAQELAAERSVR